MRAFAANRALLAELAGAFPIRPRGGRVATLLAVASIALLLADLVLVAGGVWLLVVGNIAMKFLALILIAIGLECRPRVPRHELEIGRISEADAPELFAIIEQARAALGAPRIDRVLLDNGYNAACGRSGLRRRTFLIIGLPLWGLLSPPARVALLGHELGHLVNGDPTTHVLTQAATSTFGRLVTIFDPEGMARGDGALESISMLVASVLYAPLRRLFGWAHVRLLGLAAHQSRRAEAYADALAVRLGGTEGAVELMATTLLLNQVNFAVRRVLTADGPDAVDPQRWRAAAQATVRKRDADLTVQEQASMRYEVTATASHPPTGLRLRLIRSWPRTEPSMPALDDAMASLDRRLVKQYRRARAAMLSLGLG